MALEDRCEATVMLKRKPARSGLLIESDSSMRGSRYRLRHISSQHLCLIHLIKTRQMDVPNLRLELPQLFVVLLYECPNVLSFHAPPPSGCEDGISTNRASCGRRLEPPGSTWQGLCACPRDVEPLSPAGRPSEWFCYGERAPERRSARRYVLQRLVQSIHASEKTHLTSQGGDCAVGKLKFLATGTKALRNIFPGGERLLQRPLHVARDILPTQITTAHRIVLRNS